MNTELGKRIRSLREGKQLTQEAVACSIGISRQKLARMEKGKSDITFTFLDQFSKLIGISVPEITADLSNAVPSTAYRVTSGTQGTIRQVTDMLDLFYANKHLYDKVRYE